ncbi:hypothetical protein BJ165DRAFT_1608133 [Panaeolus papilionaceus]|nr:hypothetical protein BJ165DRAFT_1608133 [Panaeolus papilionaceus]
MEMPKNNTPANSSEGQVLTNEENSPEDRGYLLSLLPEGLVVSPPNRVECQTLVAKKVEEKRRKQKDEDYIPRPLNEFIIFSTQLNKALDPYREARTAKKSGKHLEDESMDGESQRANIKLPDQCLVQRITSLMHKSLPDAEKALWKQAQIWCQEEHRRLFPDYKFRPVRKEAKENGDLQSEPSQSGPRSRKVAPAASSGATAQTTSTCSNLGFEVRQYVPSLAGPSRVTRKRSSRHHPYDMTGQQAAEVRMPFNSVINLTSSTAPQALPLTKCRVNMQPNRDLDKFEFAVPNSEEPPPQMGAPNVLPLTESYADATRPPRGIDDDTVHTPEQQPTQNQLHTGKIVHPTLSAVPETLPTNNEYAEVKLGNPDNLEVPGLDMDGTYELYFDDQPFSPLHAWENLTGDIFNPTWEF